jgi:hypothetical protein
MNEKQQLEHYQKYHKEINGELYKCCSKHTEYFPNEDSWFPCTLDNFYKRNTRDGLSTYCKKCESKKNHQWGKENKDKRHTYVRRDYLKHNGRKDYYKALSKRLIDNGHRKEWEQNNPEKIKQYRLYREQNKTHKISKKEWLDCKEYFNNECAYCGLSIEEHYIRRNGELKLGDFHREHVQHDGANDLSNCVPSCKICNSSKGTYKLEDWYINQEFFNEDKMNKIHKWLNEDYKLYINSKF